MRNKTMSKREFSEMQKKAIYETVGCNYLISAGAGSGKTAVLTERIYHLAKLENSLKCFLVLTFTNLAAGEMKSRVRKRLLNDNDTAYLASQVDNAHIETFDSFTLYLVKKYSYILGVSSDLNVIDSFVLSIKRHQVMDQIFEEHYKDKNPSFVAMMKEFCKKDDSNVKEIILKILEDADKKIDKYCYLESLKKEFYNIELVDNLLLEYVDKIHNKANFIYKEMDKVGLEDPDDESEIKEYLNNLLNINDYDKIREYLSTAKFPDKRGKVKTSDGEFRNAIAEYIKTKIKTAKDVDYGDSISIKKTYLYQKTFANEIVDLAIEIERAIDSFKLERNVFTFGDISRYALSLINNKDIKDEISNSFKYIMVDEYQDTNDVQETLINAIGKDNIYMVGDVKQSIYKFRGADCTIFQEKYKRYKQGIGGKELDLNTSYRSRKEIVDFINEIFSSIMNKNINSIDYSDGHNFEFGQKKYLPNSIYKPEVFNYQIEKSNEKISKEMSIIINDINYKIKNHFQVYDFELDKDRDCDYKDFAIIIDRKTDFAEIKSIFEEHAIPVNAFDKEDLFSSDIIYLIKSLLKILNCCLNSDYESQDFRHSFMSVARSFLFEYDDNKLHQIMVNKTYLLEPFMQKMELIKESLRFKSLYEIVTTLYEQYSLYDSICKIGQYYANTHKAETVLKIAASLDLIGFTFCEFVDYFDEIAKVDIEVEFKENISTENCVTLINVHASKGLEYGIVYYALLNKQFHRDNNKNSFVLSPKYGLLLPYTSGKFNSIFIHMSNELNMEEDYYEKTRVLYVGLTRAKQKIILLNQDKKLKKMRIIKENQANSMQDILKITNLLDKYSTDLAPETEDLQSKICNNESEPILLKEINVDSQIIDKHRASKILDSDVDSSLLDFGKLLHNYLENVDFDKKDLSFIKDLRLQKYVKNIVYSPLFKGIKNDQIKKEFYFYDESTKSEGFIDALIIKENEIDIIDYKIKNISDASYDKQLNSYRKYISSITNKPVKMYLLAAITGESREVYELVE